jgi:hypothetical protein
MVSVSGPLHFKSFNLILSKPVGGMSLVKFRIFICILDHSDFSSLLLIGSSRPQELRELVFTESTQLCFSCVQKAVLFEHIK